MSFSFVYYIIGYKIPNCFWLLLKLDYMKAKIKIIFLVIIIGCLTQYVKADVVKTVGASGADFAKLQLAFNAINNNTGGIYTGAITLQIIDNTTETGNVTLNASTNWSSLNIYPTVTGKTISGNINGAHLYIFANNVTIDGRLHQSNGTLIGTTRDLTITNAMVGSSAYTIRFEGNASYNTIKYCTIKGSSNVNYRGTIGFQSSSVLNGNGYNVISNNLITTADPANRPVYSIYSVGSTGFANNYNVVKDNEFVDFISPVLGGSAISIGAENNGWTISGNSFYEQNPITSVATSSYNIISINNASGTGFIVRDNYIGGSAVNCGGSAWTKSNEGNNAFTGININVGSTPATSVQNNTIQNINWSNSGAAAWTGISFTGSAIDMGTTSGNTIGSPTGTGSITFSAGATQAIFTGINIVNKSTGGYCSNNKIGSITASTTAGYITFNGIFNNLSTGTTQIDNNIIGSLVTANSINSGAALAGQLVYGIRSNSTGATTYKGNTIANITNSGTTGTTACINTSSGTNTIDGNFIYNILNPNSTSANPVTLQGTYIGASTASATYTYSNNIIKLGSDIPTVIYGIMEENTTATGTTKINFNTIYLTGNQASGSATSSFCFRSTNSTANLRDIRNNIFVSTRSTTGGSSLHYVFYYGVVPSSNSITCDYNDYYFVGTAGILARFNASYPGALPIVTGQIGNDVNSKKIDPVFSNPGGTLAQDYLPSPAVTTLIGTSGTGVTTDYAGVIRSTPKMGAFESSFVSTAQNISGLTLTANSSLTVLSGGHLTIDESKTLNTITVERGGKLTNASGQTLTLTTLNLKSDASGTATYVDNGTSAITTANVEQYLTGGRNWYITSPVASSPRNVITNATYVYKFDEPTLTWPTENTTLSPLVGYIAATTSTGTVTFTGGTLNTGIQTLTNLSWSSTDASKKGFNLMGNPYPSYLDWEQTTKTGLSTTMWYRSRNASNTAYVFDTYNATNHQGTSLNGSPVTQYIPPMQAFWVRATSATNTFTANNTMRSHESGTNRLKAKSTDTQQVLRLVVSNGSNFDETLVLFNESAQNGFDDYDSPKMSNNTISIPEIYTQVGEQKLVMNGMNAIKYETEIPLGFTTGEFNNFSIMNTQMTNFPAGTKLILKDKLLNTEKDLSGDTPYTFESGVSNSTDRFSLIFRNLGSTTEIENAETCNTKVFVNTANQITILAPEKCSYAVYNAIGQKQLDAILKSTEESINKHFNAGVYFVELSQNGLHEIKKVVIR